MCRRYGVMEMLCRRDIARWVGWWVCIAFTASLGCGSRAGAPSVNGGRTSEVTPESLGLEANAESRGTDPKGRLWFEVPGKPERWVYDPEEKTLFQATKQPNGEWKLTAKPEVTAESLGLGPGVK